MADIHHIFRIRASANTIFDAIGLDQDIGSLEPGKLADLVILNANPLETIRNTNAIDQVMKNGRLYNASTLAETYPEQRAMQSLWWWSTEPGDIPGMN